MEKTLHHFKFGHECVMSGPPVPPSLILGSNALTRGPIKKLIRSGDSKHSNIKPGGVRGDVYVVKTKLKQDPRHKVVQSFFHQQ